MERENNIYSSMKDDVWESGVRLLAKVRELSNVYGNPPQMHYDCIPSELLNWFQHCNLNNFQPVQQNQEISRDEQLMAYSAKQRETCCSKCRKLTSRVEELESEVCTLQSYVSQLSSQLHDAKEKAEDISFIKNESVIVLGDKLEVVTNMLEEKITPTNSEVKKCKTEVFKDNIMTLETPQEVSRNLSEKLSVAESLVSEIRVCIKGIKEVISISERNSV